MKVSKNYILLLFLMLLIGSWVAQGFYLPLSNEGEPKNFQVEAGQGVFEVSENLEDEDLIKNDFLFNILFLLKGRKTVKAGTYTLSKKMNIAEIFEKLTEGKVIPREITVVEG